MTERRGARAARPGSEDEDDAPEDDKLTAMRAVWLSMRDEEPPSGGLDALLAAARTKAAELQPAPSWWQRAVAGLRRPPVFAFATALVLVAGAVVVERNVKTAAPEVASSTVAIPAPGQADLRAGTPTRDEAGEPSSGAGEPSSGAGEPSSGASAPAGSSSEAKTSRAGSVAGPAGGADPGPAPSGPSSRGVSQRAVAPASSRAAPVEVAPRERDDDAMLHQAAPSRAHAAALSDRASAADMGVAAEPPGREVARARATSAPTASSPPPAPVSPARPPADRPAESAPRSEQAPADRPAESAPRSEQASAPHLEGTGAGPTTDAKTPSAGRASPALYAQCEEAAARGDCGTVQRLAARIGAADPGYRARLPRGSAIARCLAR